MFDIGWQEIFVVAILALIIVGPKDLPRAIRTMSAWVRKARKLGREFQAGVNEMMREAELEDVKKQLTDGKKLGADLSDTVSRSLDFEELGPDGLGLDGPGFDGVKDKTALPAPENVSGEVIDVVAQDVVEPADVDESVMPLSGNKNGHEERSVDEDEQPIISLDDDVMPVDTKKTEPRQ